MTASFSYQLFINWLSHTTHFHFAVGLVLCITLRFRFRHTGLIKRLSLIYSHFAVGLVPCSIGCVASGALYLMISFSYIVSLISSFFYSLLHSLFAFSVCILCLHSLFIMLFKELFAL